MQATLKSYIMNDSIYVSFETNFRNIECIICCLDLARIKEGQEDMVKMAKKPTIL